jgi:hypothetical protein
VPGNSLGSPEGRTARAAAEAKLAEQQAQALADLESAQEVSDQAVASDANG